jgi:hypothetical protein
MIRRVFGEITGFPECLSYSIPQSAIIPFNSNGMVFANNQIVLLKYGHEILSQTYATISPVTL